MEKIKFDSDGKWSDHPKDPIFEVKSGEIRSVSYDLAKLIINSGKGERVTSTQEPTQQQESKKKRGRPKKENPAAEDKGNAESQ